MIQDFKMIFIKTYYYKFISYKHENRKSLLKGFCSFQELIMIT